MITLSMTQDANIIKSLMLSGEIKEALEDDLYKIEDTYEPNMTASIWLLIRQDDVPVGFVSLEHKSALTCEMHIGFLKAFDRRYWTEIVAKFITLMTNGTPYHKIQGYISSYNLAAIAVAKRFGFKEEGRLKETGLRNGKYYDTVVFGKILDKKGKCNGQQ